MTESSHHHPETALTTGPVARGITITGLASVRWRSGADSPLAQIQHAHDDWFANTVRLQVGVPLLRGKSNATASWRGGGPVAALRSYLATPANGMTGTLNGNHYNTDFLAYLDQAVDLAQQLGLAVVICAQHENLDYTAMPEGNDIAFWKIIHDHYGPDVICDLFNEPAPAALYANAWAGWHSGGAGSDGVRYTGFQSLVNQLRTYGLSNTFWVEGCGHSGTLAGINGTAGNHQLTDPDNNLVYSMHHPQGPHTPANWDQQFGYLVGLGIPVVVGEWTNYAKKNAECWPNASTDVPAFLNYLTGLGVCGLVVWSLRPGVLVVDHTTWQPTQILASYKCDGSVSGQGAGQLIQDQFQQWAQPGPGTAAAGQGAASR
jgi:hypothetical protein